MPSTSSSPAAELPLTAASARAAGDRRWLVAGLLFAATLINYVDRLTLSVLAPVLKAELGLSSLGYASLQTWFLLAYALSMAPFGRLYDRIGTRLGFAVAIAWWSVAAMAHALGRGVGSLGVCRFLLGMGEAGNWPGAAKAVAERFPVRERAFAMGIVNCGAALGSVIAPPLIVFLQLRFGWQVTFVATGALGLVWLCAWLALMPPARPNNLSHSPASAPSPSPTAVDEGPLPLRTLVRHRPFWGIVVARFLGDPLWWLYLMWLPLYLREARGFSLAEIGLFAWVPFAAADAGSLAGGWFSGHLIRRGVSVRRARIAAITIGGALMPAGALAAVSSSAAGALAWIAVVLFAFQFWVNNVQTLPSDLFPVGTVASVSGAAGSAAAFGAMAVMLATGWIVDRFSYTPVLVGASALGPLATVAAVVLTRPGGRR